MQSQLSKRKILLLACGIVGFCYCFAIKFGAMTYHTNDDVAWQNMISHFTFDGLWWHPPFPSILMTYPIGLLCYFIPQIPWWYVISQLLVMTGMLVTHYVVLSIGQMKRVPFWLVILLLGVFDAVYNVICIAEIAWTIVPVVTGSGIISLVFYYPYIKDSRKKWVAAYILIGAILSLAHRRETGIIVIAFFLLSVAYTLTQKYGFLRKTMVTRMMGISLVFGVLIVGITVLNRVVDPIAQGEEWQSYSSARSAFIDFTHDSYESNPELYKAVGWSADVAGFAEQWNFLSEEVTEESFRFISENSNSSPVNASFLQRVKLMYGKIRADVLTQNTILAAVIIIVMSFVWLLCRRDLCNAWFIALNGGAVAIVLLYLGVVVERVLFRTVFIILYPGVLVNLLLVVNSYKKPKNRIGRNAILSCMVVSAIVVGSLFYGIMGRIYGNQKLYKEREYNQLVQEEYLHQHPENMYIIQGYSSISYKRYSPEPEDNSEGTGGTMWKSNWWKQIVADNGLETINWETFKRPNVYYLGSLDDKTKSILIYLQKEFGCKGIAVIESLEEFAGSRYCMKFVYKSNESQYSVYYSVVDGEYVEITP